ncbi:MAG: hypothetical protein AAB428_02910 [Patescibacteria group bacterium]
MKIITTTNARKHMSSIINRVKYHGEIFAIGRHKMIDVLLVQFPDVYNSEVNDITNINAYSKSFDFLKNEPELYSMNSLKKKYA